MVALRRFTIRQKSIAVSMGVIFITDYGRGDRAGMGGGRDPKAGGSGCQLKDQVP
jgi:hypothetical protein